LQPSKREPRHEFTRHPDRCRCGGTIPGKGWNVMLRFHGPLEPWFDKTWRPGEIELVN
jgi:hypothetical protein